MENNSVIGNFHNCQMGIGEQSALHGVGAFKLLSIIAYMRVRDSDFPRLVVSFIDVFFLFGPKPPPGAGRKLPGP